MSVEGYFIGHPFCSAKLVSYAPWIERYVDGISELGL